MKRARSGSASTFLRKEPDVIVIDFHGDEWKLHFEALVEASEFFRSAFSPDVQEKRIQLTFPDRHHVFPHVVDFIYGGPASVEYELKILCPLLEMCQDLGIPRLEKHLLSELNKFDLPNRTKQVFMEALSHNGIPILELCLGYIDQHHIVKCLKELSFVADKSDLSEFSWLIDFQSLCSGDMRTLECLNLASDPSLLSFGMFSDERRTEYLYLGPHFESDCGTTKNSFFISMGAQNPQYLVALAEYFRINLEEGYSNPHTVTFNGPFPLELFSLLPSFALPQIREFVFRNDFPIEYLGGFTHFPTLWNLSFSSITYHDTVSQEVHQQNVSQVFAQMEALLSLSLGNFCAPLIKSIPSLANLSSFDLSISHCTPDMMLLVNSSLLACPNLTCLSIRLSDTSSAFPVFSGPSPDPLSSLLKLSWSGPACLLSYLAPCPNAKSASFWVKQGGDLHTFASFLHGLPQLHDIFVDTMEQISLWPTLTKLKRFSGRFDWFGAAIGLDPEFFVHMPHLQDLDVGFYCGHMPLGSLPACDTIKRFDFDHSCTPEDCTKIGQAFPNLTEAHLFFQDDVDVFLCIRNLVEHAKHIRHLEFFTGELPFTLPALRCKLKRALPQIPVIIARYNN